jgi:hypothetical protein
MNILSLIIHDTIKFRLINEEFVYKVYIVNNWALKYGCDFIMFRGPGFRAKDIIELCTFLF